MYQNMVKSGLLSGGHIRPRGYENMAGFRPGPGPDMISGETLVLSEVNVM